MWRYILALLVYMAMTELLAYIRQRDLFPSRDSVRKYRDEILYNYQVAPLLGVAQAVELCLRGKSLGKGIFGVIVYVAGAIMILKILPNLMSWYLAMGSIIIMNVVSIFAVPPYQPKQVWPSLAKKARR